MPETSVRLTPQTIRNRLLRALPAGELEQLWPLLTQVDLALKDALVVQGEPVAAIHFLEVGTVSMITTMEDGARMEVGLVGPEGIVGLSLLLGAETSALEGMVQVEGTALRLSAAAFRSALADAPSLLGLLLRYVEAFHSQVAQSAACNGRHQIEQRLARWILMTHDRVDGDEFLMTQEFIATMLGVQRPGVTLAIGVLSRAGLVAHRRGCMHVLDRQGLEAASCECYATVQRRFAWLTA